MVDDRRVLSEILDGVHIFVYFERSDRSLRSQNDSERIQMTVCD